MTPTESASSVQIPKKTQPEQYDLVVLGDGTGSTLAAWKFASEGNSRPSATRDGRKRAHYTVTAIAVTDALFARPIPC
jgi:hypothetical protein